MPTTDDLRATTGRIFEIQRFSIHDGPGIRTTVFMKGCSLNCRWCHNPESLAGAAQLSFVPDKCIGCGYCFRVCPNEAHQMVNERHVLDRDRCTACGKCTVECYAEALELVGRTITAGEALDEVRKDQPFYDNSGGGITLSGGEPTQQFAFTHALLRLARDAGLHNVIETNGHAAWDRYEQLLPLVDLFLYDYKATDPTLHRELTGVDNALILANLRRLHDAGAAIILRCPLVPGLNVTPEHFAGIARVAGELPRLQGVELMPYHRLGESKIERLGLTDRMPLGIVPPDRATVTGWIDQLAALGLEVLNHRDAD